MSTLTEFYLACRSGDLNAVQQLLPSLSDEHKNNLESNDSTALHAASYYGHHDIVKLLLENGCATWILNKYKNTPYDEAKDEEMRQLFRRPDRNGDSNRFTSVEDCFSIVTRNTAEDNNGTGEDEKIPKGWIDGYKHTGTAQEREATIGQIVHAQMMKYCLKKFEVSNTCQDVFKLLKKAIPAGDPEYKRTKTLFENFRTKQDVDELVRLYTLETPLYDALQRNVDSFAIELYSHLSSLEARAFKGGQTYRGLTMTNESIDAYRWAAKDQGRMIEIKTMTSTSLLKEVAIDFARKKTSVDGIHTHRVLCILEFPHICYTAIDLNVITPLSAYPHEKEILLLPGTLFEVREVSKDQDSGWFMIRLENIPVPHQVLKKALAEFHNA